MCYALCSIHGPTLITSCCMSESQQKIYMSRGNELISQNFEENSFDIPQIRRLFGNILKICVIEDINSSYLAVLLENDILELYNIKNESYRCIQKSHISGLIGDVTKPMMAASDKCIITHTRKRTLTIFTLTQVKLIANSFNVNVPFDKIYGIITTPGSISDFAVLGRDLSHVLLVSFFKITENDISFVFDVQIEGTSELPYIAEYPGYLAAVCANKTVTFIQDENNKHILQTKIPEIVTITKASESIAILSDSVGNIYTAAVHGMQNMEKKQIKLNRASEIVRLSNNIFMKLSSFGDAHLLKYDAKNIEVIDTYASFNTARCMLRSLFVTKEGKIRSLENGSATNTVAHADIDNGTDVFGLSDILVISSFDKTVVLNNDFETVEISHVDLSARTIALAGTDSDNFIQITTKRAFVVRNGKEVFNEFFTDEIFFASTDGNCFILCTADKIYTYSADDYKKQEYPIQASSVGCCENKFSYSTWSDNVLTVLENDQIFNFKFDEMITNIYITPNIIYCIASANVYMLQNGNITKIVSDKIFNKIRNINGRPFICGSQSGFLDGDKIDYFTSNYSIDATSFGGMIAFLKEDGLDLIEQDGVKHHTHINEYTAEGLTITCAAIDENGDCPKVFGALNMNNECELVSPDVKSARMLPKEIPIQMEWISIKQRPFLAVLSNVSQTASLSIYTPQLERAADLQLVGAPSTLCFVDKTYIAVAHGHSLSIITTDINEDKIVSLKVSSTVPGRSKCSSLTSPNSCFVIYADAFASCTIYSVINGIATEVTRDISSKKLKFAAAISNDLVFALENSGTALGLRISGNKMRIESAFNIGANIIAGFSSPPVTFSTSTGSLIGLFKVDNDQAAMALYRSMRSYLYDLACETCGQWRKVTRNGREIGTGNFIDGDLLILFNSLSNEDKEMIVLHSGINMRTATKVAESIEKLVVDYRMKTQNPIKL